MPTWIPKMHTLVPWLSSWAQLGQGLVEAIGPHESCVLEPGQMLVTALHRLASSPATHPLHLSSWN